MRKISFLVMTLVTSLVISVGTVAAQPQNFVANLSGGEEVPSRATNAAGGAKFQLDSSGGALGYKLIVANIDNVVAAHIHCAARGSNGSVGVTLFTGGTPGGGPVNGILAQGAVTTPDAANACGWADLAAVVTAMQSGNTYVNVHTNDGVVGDNTGPGDFKSGEIRGQIR